MDLVVWVPNNDYVHEYTSCRCNSSHASCGGSLLRNIRRKVLKNHPFDTSFLPFGKNVQFPIKKKLKRSQDWILLIIYTWQFLRLIYLQTKANQQIQCGIINIVAITIKYLTNIIPFFHSLNSMCDAQSLLIFTIHPLFCRLILFYPVSRFLFSPCIFLRPIMSLI